MKKILPILTLALLGTAMTVSAATSFDEYADKYSYYESADVGGVSGSGPAVQTIDYGTYQVVKTGESYKGTDLLYQSRFKIHAKEKVTLYLYDYLDNIKDNTTDTVAGYYNSNAMANKNISEIGYRVFDKNGNITDQGSHALANDLNLEPEVVTTQSANGPVNVTRNVYYLGEFNPGNDVEIYMKFNDGSEIYSNTVDMPGGYYGGNGASPYARVDKLMLAYKGGNEAVAAKAMPIAYLANTGNEVSFGILAIAPQGGAVGGPLPGGLQIALIAGLFGLGFWYVRRRKAVTA